MDKKRLNTSGIVYSTNPDLKVSYEEEQRSVTVVAKDQLLRVRLDAKHRGGKIVTVVDSFSGTANDLEKLGKQLKTFCGTGGSVKNNEILVQGDNREKIVQWFHKNGYLKTRKI
ncbi:MAG: translation initiation factor [Ginsengibacter sp.]